ncbi:tandem-95 repeat protein [Pseudahrensia aquimaris]|uniref:Tandem-95 repeat protein n=1 Tax=Pseudahrensia aquimaris TaxID=744461 RepID=A0ABW3FEQ0_9HYPH
MPAPSREKPLMRALEPRILLDAATVETALDIAGQAAHSQLADDYMATSHAVQDETDGAAAGVKDFERSGESVASERREIVFIDAGVPDQEDLISALEPGAQVVMIEAGRDGVEQIAQALEGAVSYDAVHIFAHGSAGSLQLGDGELTAATITGQYRETLRGLSQALGDDADILIYGCSFGQGAVGERAAALLAEATGADIAASDDLTGHESLSGDWDLEVQVGEVEATVFSAPEWQGILGPEFTIEALAQPEISNPSGGVVGMLGTVALWNGAVTFDPDNGDPTQTFSLRATVLQQSETVSTTFETVQPGGDMRVVLTNFGAEVGTNGPDRVLTTGTTGVLWEIIDPVTGMLANPAEINITFSDIDGRVGSPMIEESVNINLANLYGYTTEAGTDLDISDDDFDLMVAGTTQGNNNPLSQVGAYWANSSQFLVSYNSNTTTVEFDMDGNGDVIFSNPVVTPTQELDLDGNDSTAVGQNYTVAYLNGLPAGPIADSPVPIVDQDVTIMDIDSYLMESVVVTLTNASSGDVLNVDTGVMTALGINATVDTSMPGEIVVTLAGRSLNENYETALQAITYENTESDANFDRTTPRIITFELRDGLITTTGAQTTITFGVVDGTPNAVPNVYVENEDTPINATAATGLLANDRDPDGGNLNVIAAFDSNGDAISVGGPPANLPSGATFLLNSDGSFSYFPASNESGTEFIRYTISDGTQLTTSWATFNIKPVVDPITLDVVQPDNVSDEDASSDPISVSFSVADPSQTQTVRVNNIPTGVVLTDGTNIYTSPTPFANVEIDGWDLSQLRVLPLENSDEDITINIVATTQEADGSMMMDTRSVTFEVNAVADAAIIAIDAVGGPVDATVQIGTAITLELFDEDGSEMITDIMIGNIPTGAQIFVSGVERTVTAGMINLSLADLSDVLFVPPQTGNDVIYPLEVFVTTTEVSPENNVTSVSNVVGPVPLVIDLNSNDDPVAAVNDRAITGSGIPVTLPLLFNDFIPDGGGLVTEVDGQGINTSNPVTLPNGMGVVSMDSSENIIFTPSGTFSGLAVFTYGMRDLDGSTDSATVVVDVQPVWNISGPTSPVNEGDNAVFEIELFGAQEPGKMVSVDFAFSNLGASAADVGVLYDALDDAVAFTSDDGFSRVGDTLEYTAPLAAYPAVVDPAGTFVDISGPGDSDLALSLGNDGIASTGIGFDFNFFGEDYDSVFVSSDGYVTFGSPIGVSNNVALDGTAFGGRPAIAALWDDLTQASGDVLVRTTDAPEGIREFIIQWNDVSREGGGPGTGTFQLILSEADGSVRMNYQDIDFGGGASGGQSATVGIEGPNGLFTNYSFDGSPTIANGTSILFSRPNAVTPTMTVALSIVDDPTFEIRENFALSLSNSVNTRIGLDVAQVTIEVSDNSAPNAQDDTVIVDEITVGQIDVLNNPFGSDTDAEGHSLTTNAVNGSALIVGESVTIPSGAIVTMQSNGVFTYDPNGVFNSLPPGGLGADSFTYRVEDEFGASSIATVNVQIDGINIITVVDLNGPLLSGPSGISSFSPDDPPLRINSLDAEVVDGDNDDFTRLDLTLVDFLQSGSEVVTVAGHALTFGTADTQTVTFAGESVDITYDGAADISVVLNGGGAMPIALVNEILREVTYQNTSSADLAGLRQIEFQTNDGIDPSLVATARINVVGSNVAPDAQDDVLSTPVAEDSSITIAASTLLFNDSDADFDPITIIAVDGGANGNAVLDGSGDVVFTPNADFNGTAQFTYTIADGNGATADATVTITVTSVLDAPRIDLNGVIPGRDYTANYVEGGAPVSLLDSTGFVLNPDGGTIDTLTITLTNGFVGDRFSIGALPGGIAANVTPSSGLTGLTADGPVTIILSNPTTSANYTAALQAITFETISDAPNLSGRMIEISANGNGLDSNSATVAISVSPTNDGPQANDDGFFTLLEDASFVISPTDLLANDTDPDLEPLTVTDVLNPINGSVTFMGNGDIRFVPDADYFGPAAFDYEISDADGETSIATVRLTVQSVNDVPELDLDGTASGIDHQDTYFENGPGVALVSADLTLTDRDDSNLAFVTARLTNGLVGDRLFSEGTLPAGITLVVNPSSNLIVDGEIQLSLAGNATLADYRSALQTLRFETSSDRPDVTPRQIEIVANDGEDTSLIAISEILIVPVNDAPVAVNDGPFVLAEDTTLIIAPSALLSNDSDPDGDALTFMSIDNVTNGSAVITGSGDIEFTPDSDYFGPAQFDYVINDGNGETAIGTVTLDVTPVNDTPFIDLDANELGIDFSASYTENDPPIAVVDGTVTLADVDDAQLEGVTLVLTNGRIGDVLSHEALPSGITASITPSSALVVDGTITMTLFGSASLADYQIALQAVRYASVSEDPNETTRTITIQADDGETTSLVATSSIAVTAVNDLPTAVGDGPLTTGENEALTITPAELLGNDIDLDDTNLTITSVSGATNGTVVINGSGNIIYTPDNAYFGSDSFDYEITDPDGAVSTATVAIDVTPINDAPELDANGVAASGVNYTITYTENDAPLSIVAADFDIYDQDDTELESAEIVLTNGQIGDRLTAPGSLGAISIFVSPTGSLVAPGPVTISLVGTGTIAEYEAAFAAIEYANVTEEPDTTPRVLEMTAFDGEDTSIVVTTTINVVSVNDLPVANADQALSIDEDGVLTVDPADLMANDTDLEAAPLVFSGVGNPLNGTVALNGSGLIEFTPDANFFGAAGFEYTITDGDGATASAFVDVLVSSVNDEPDVDLNGGGSGDNYVAQYTENDAPIAVIGSSVAVGDVDDANIESAVVQLTNGQVGDIVSAPANVGPISISVTPSGTLSAPGPVTVLMTGTATLAEYEAALASVLYSSDSESPSTDDRVFSVTVNDGTDDSPAATSTIEVISVNDVPVAQADAGFTMLEDGTITISPLANDTDLDGDVLQIIEIDGVAIAPGETVNIANGSVTLAADGMDVEFVPAADYNGAISFSYRVTDGQASDVSSVSIDVIPVNDAPRPQDDGPVILAEDTSVSFNPIAANDSDPEGDPLTLTAVQGIAVSAGSSVPVDNGTIVVDADGETLLFTPNPDFFGQVVVSYTVSDGTDTASAEIIYDVTPVNDPTLAVSTPSNRTLNDGEIVNLPMGQHFADVDGDALAFAASGLPAGLSINASTGIISGQIASDASQSGPYTITVEATDGLSPVASVSFNMDVLNTIPTASPAQTVPLFEGSDFAYVVGDLFNDADGDVLTIDATGLPVWMSYDVSNGVLTGTVPSDAALFGPVTVALAADDNQGGTAATVVTFVPQNEAPVPTGPAPIIRTQETQDVFFDVSAAFVDGGNDTDPLTFQVTGLPAGLTFAPDSALISGTLEAGTQRVEPYYVIMTADDGQGGVVSQTLTLRVFDLGSAVEEPKFGGVAADEASAFALTPSRLVSATEVSNSSLLDALNEAEDLSGIDLLDDNSLILTAAVDGMDSLNATQSASIVGGAIPEEAFDDLDAAGEWIGAAVSEDTYLPGSSEAVSVENLTIEANRTGAALFIEITMPGDDRSFMDDLTIALRGGDELPAWMKVLRAGFISANPPANVIAVELELSIGEEAKRMVRVDLADGSVVELVDDGKDEKAGAPVIEKPVEPERIRGSK